MILKLKPYSQVKNLAVTVGGGGAAPPLREAAPPWSSDTVTYTEILRCFAARSLLQIRSRGFPSKAWFSTEDLTPSPPSHSLKVQDSLYKRVTYVGDRWKSVLSVLEEWVGEGKLVEKIDLQYLVK